MLLAQAVPIGGAIILAGLSVQMMEASIRDGTRICRLRFLTKKYGLDIAEWVARFLDIALSESRCSAAG